MKIRTPFGEFSVWELLLAKPLLVVGIRARIRAYRMQREVARFRRVCELLRDGGEK